MSEPPTVDDYREVAGMPPLPSDVRLSAHHPTGRGWKVAGAVLLTVLTISSATCSIVGQGISYRQMRALERLSGMQRCVP